MALQENVARRSGNFPDRDEKTASKETNQNALTPHIDSGMFSAHFNIHSQQDRLQAHPEDDASPNRHQRGHTHTSAYCQDKAEPFVNIAKEYDQEDGNRIGNQIEKVIEIQLGGKFNTALPKMIETDFTEEKALLAVDIKDIGISSSQVINQFQTEIPTTLPIPINMVEGNEPLQVAVMATADISPNTTADNVLVIANDTEQFPILSGRLTTYSLIPGEPAGAQVEQAEESRGPRTPQLQPGGYGFHVPVNPNDALEAARFLNLIALKSFRCNVVTEAIDGQQERLQVTEERLNYHDDLLEYANDFIDASGHDANFDRFSHVSLQARISARQGGTHFLESGLHPNSSIHHEATKSNTRTSQAVSNESSSRTNDPAKHDVNSESIYEDGESPLSKGILKDPANLASDSQQGPITPFQTPVRSTIFATHCPLSDDPSERIQALETNIESLRRHMHGLEGQLEVQASRICVLESSPLSPEEFLKFPDPSIDPDVSPYRSRVESRESPKGLLPTCKYVEYARSSGQVSQPCLGPASREVAVAPAEALPGNTAFPINSEMTPLELHSDPLGFEASSGNSCWSEQVRPDLFPDSICSNSSVTAGGKSIATESAFNNSAEVIKGLTVTPIKSKSQPSKSLAESTFSNTNFHKSHVEPLESGAQSGYALGFQEPRLLPCSSSLIGPVTVTNTTLKTSAEVAGTSDPKEQETIFTLADRRPNLADATMARYWEDKLPLGQVDHCRQHEALSDSNPQPTSANVPALRLLKEKEKIYEGMFTSMDGSFTAKTSACQDDMVLSTHFSPSNPTKAFRSQSPGQKIGRVLKSQQVEETTEASVNTSLQEELRELHREIDLLNSRIDLSGSAARAGTVTKSASPQSPAASVEVVDNFPVFPVESQSVPQFQLESSQLPLWNLTEPPAGFGSGADSASCDSSASDAKAFIEAEVERALGAEFFKMRNAIIDLNSRVDLLESLPQSVRIPGHARSSSSAFRGIPATPMNLSMVAPPYLPDDPELLRRYIELELDKILDVRLALFETRLTSRMERLEYRVYNLSLTVTALWQSLWNLGWAVGGWGIWNFS